MSVLHTLPKMGEGNFALSPLHLDADTGPIPTPCSVLLGQAHHQQVHGRCLVRLRTEVHAPLQQWGWAGRRRKHLPRRSLTDLNILFCLVTSFTIILIMMLTISTYGPLGKK